MKKKLQVIGMLIFIFAVLALVFFTTGKKETPVKDNVSNSAYIITSYEQADVIKAEYGSGKEIDNYVLASKDQWKLENSTLKIDSAPLVFSTALMTNFSSNEKFDEETSDYGTKKSTTYAKVTLKDGTQLTFTIGDKTPDGTFNYILVSGSENDGIYTIPVLICESLMLDKNKVALKDFEQIDFPTLSKVVINQKNYQNLVLETTEDVEVAENLQGISTLIMKSPYPNKTIFMQNFIDDVFPTITALGFGDLVESDTVDLKKYGLNEPFLIIEIVSENGSINLEVGDKTSDEKYYVKNVGENHVFLMTRELLEPFIDVDCFDFLNRFITLIPIEKTDSVAISSKDKTFIFDNNKLNNIQLTEDEASSFYKKVVSVQLDAPLKKQDVKTKNLYATYEFNLLDKTKEVYEFYDYNEQYCTYFDKQSNLWFLVGKASINDTLTTADSLVK